MILYVPAPVAQHLDKLLVERTVFDQRGLVRQVVRVLFLVLGLDLVPLLTALLDCIGLWKTNIRK